ncbi:MAG: hypothetical protein ACI9OJ_005398 [Myxococcota bacterium]|jgi:hypothetical protein
MLPLTAVARKANMGKLAIFSMSKGATVEVDGRKVGTIPLAGPLELPTGTHTVRVHARGHLEFNETVGVEGGKLLELDADLIPTAGMLRIESNVPGATVAIDGNLAGKTPFDSDVPPGKHVVLVQSKGYAPYTESIEIKAGKWVDLRAELARTSDGNPDEDGGIATKWWLWTIVGGLVAVGLGVGLGVGLQPDDKEAESDKTWELP